VHRAVLAKIRLSHANHATGQTWYSFCSLPRYHLLSGSKLELTVIYSITTAGGSYPGTRPLAIFGMRPPVKHCSHTSLSIMRFGGRSLNLTLGAFGATIKDTLYNQDLRRITSAQHRRFFKNLNDKASAFFLLSVL
jgi:hypothetical protein